MKLQQDQMPDMKAYETQLRDDLDRFLYTAESRPEGRGTRWVWEALLESFLKRMPEE
jgi:hypothetical protein